MDESSNVQRMIEQARDAMTVRRVFGDPYEKNGVTVIPAARVQGGAGGGGGEGPEGQGSGTGGGFGVNAKPAGAFVVRGDDVDWRPAIDVNRIIMGGQLIAAAALLLAVPWSALGTGADGPETLCSLVAHLSRWLYVSAANTPTGERGVPRCVCSDGRPGLAAAVVAVLLLTVPAIGATGVITTKADEFNPAATNTFITWNMYHNEDYIIYGKQFGGSRFRVNPRGSRRAGSAASRAPH